jgi:hypothetical protein
MIKKGKLALPLALILAIALVVPVMAQEGETLPCGGEGVSGTVVAVDEETGEVTLDAGADLGWCTVTLDGEYEHPIVSLLGSYFGDVSADDLAAALEGTQGYAVYDPDTGEWTWTDGEGEDAVAVTVIAENEDGTFTILVGGEEVTISVDDPAVAEDLREALQALAVDWGLDGEGGVVQPGDEIAAYHDDGLGFGVLVKLYAMAAALEDTCADAEEPCGATVDELVAAFQSGMGMGDLMEEYGKPTVLGIGHIKGKDRDKPEHAGPKDRDDEEDDGLQPEHAGPKDKPTPPGQAKEKNDPPGHANSKPKKPKKNK